MKKIFARIVLIVFAMSVFGLIIWSLYVAPLAESDADIWWEYIVYSLILTVMYAIVFLAIHGIFKLIEWASNQID